MQTNPSGDLADLIDPATNEVVDVILGLPIAHGVTSHPSGKELYFSSEVDHTLDVLAPSAGGDHFHSGGRRWFSQEDPEWQMLAAWVRGQGTACLVG